MKLFNFLTRTAPQFTLYRKQIVSEGGELKETLNQIGKFRGLFEYKRVEIVSETGIKYADRLILKTSTEIQNGDVIEYQGKRYIAQNVRQYEDFYEVELE